MKKKDIFVTIRSDPQRFLRAIFLATERMKHVRPRPNRPLRIACLVVAVILFVMIWR